MLTFSLFLTHEINGFDCLEFGVDAMSSFGFFVVVDGTTNSSRRSSDVVDSTRSMCHESSHGQSIVRPNSIDRPSLCLGGQWTSSATNACLGLGSSRSGSSDVGLRNRFRAESRSSICFLVVVVVGNKKSVRTETIGLDSEQRNERSDFTRHSIVEHSFKCWTTFPSEQPRCFPVVGNSHE